MGGARSLLVSSNLRGGERLTWLVHSALGPFGKSRRGNSLRSWPGRSTRTPRPAAGGSVGRVIVKVFPPRGDLFGRTSLSHSSLFSRGWFFSWPRCVVASARTSGAHHAPSCCGCACSGSGEYGDRVARAPVGGVGQSGTSSTSPASRIMPSSLLSSVVRTAVLMTGLFGRVRRPDDGPLLEGTRELRVGGRCRRRRSG